MTCRFVVLIAEFKPVDGHQTLESDKIKIGIEMKKMPNELLGIGIKDSLVCAISVMNDHLDMFKMLKQSRRFKRIAKISEMARPWYSVQYPQTGSARYTINFKELMQKMKRITNKDT